MTLCRHWHWHCVLRCFAASLNVNTGPHLRFYSYSDRMDINNVQQCRIVSIRKKRTFAAHEKRKPFSYRIKNTTVKFGKLRATLAKHSSWTTWQGGEYFHETIVCDHKTLVNWDFFWNFLKARNSCVFFGLFWSLTTAMCIYFRLLSQCRDSRPRKVSWNSQPPPRCWVDHEEFSRSCAWFSNVLILGQRRCFNFSSAAHIDDIVTFPILQLHWRLLDNAI
jgi:hypothetical protein